MLFKDDKFDLAAYLNLMDDGRINSIETTDEEIDNLLLEQIRKDVRAERWDSMRNCK